MLRFGRKRKSRAQVLADRARDDGDWTLAAHWYREVLRKQPRHAAIWVQYGHALKETGDVGGGERAYRQALALAPKVADTHLQLGHALKLQGRMDEAAAAYVSALAIEPGLQAAATEVFASLVRVAGGEARAKQQIVDPNLQLGQALELHGRTHEAAAAYLSALAIEPGLHAAAIELFGLLVRIAKLEAGWKQHVPAFLNAVSSVGAFAHEQARLAQEVGDLRRDVDALKGLQS